MPFAMHRQPLLYIFISAACFGIRPPLAKLLVADIPPVALAGLLYTGAFLGLSVYSIGQNFFQPHLMPSRPPCR